MSLQPVVQPAKKRKVQQMAHPTDNDTPIRARFGYLATKEAAKKFEDQKDLLFFEKLTDYPLIEVDSEVFGFFDFVLRQRLSSLLETKNKTLLSIQKINIPLSLGFWGHYWNKATTFRYRTKKVKNILLWERYGVILIDSEAEFHKIFGEHCLAKRNTRNSLTEFFDTQLYSKMSIKFPDEATILPDMRGSFSKLSEKYGMILAYNFDTETLSIFAHVVELNLFGTEIPRT